MTVKKRLEDYLYYRLLSPLPSSEAAAKTAVEEMISELAFLNEGSMGNLCKTMTDKEYKRIFNAVIRRWKNRDSF